ncbi:hypothetical protein BLX24_08415 [Arsenicibacter rosenii]|uniref:Phosphatidic acid phosphatase type 2/haloperoxidase domain-containing protein n=1 Tax=Arsenicibacter rosenii TaxID=1750698 RepID=A0A1S2VML9_9BACT|nr:hypothetical protein BLX24_08415 [Arsenicibacter rosenii]
MPVKAQQIDSVYRLKTSREVVLFGVGAASGIASLVAGQTLDPLTPQAIQALQRSQLAGINRGAAYQWSPTADQLSDLTFVGTVGVAGLVALPTLRQKGRAIIPVMFLETALLTNGIQRTVKNIAQETRPYVYNPDVALSVKTGKDARRSFFSGHTSNAFAAAVFASTVFSHLHPDSRLKPLVWGGSLVLATGTGLLRYKAGQHFPADLVVGAAFGSVIGWVVPKLHQRTGKRQLSVAPWANGQASGVYVRYVPVYR